MSKQKLSTEPYKGTRDFYPTEMRFRKWMFGQCSKTVESFGYEPYDGPMLESFDLYAAKTGEEIVNQQLYWLIDKGERKLAVRPEMTPTLARMVAAKLNELPKPIRWYSIPNLWRYERPQRGRLREHWQLNVDLLGGDLLMADVEILNVALQLMNSFGAMGGADSAQSPASSAPTAATRFQIRFNHRGLMDHFFNSVLKLTAEQGHKVIKAIDMRDKVKPEVFLNMVTDAGLPASEIKTLEDFFTLSLEETARAYPCAGVQHLLSVQKLLNELGLGQALKFDATIMRGMDYYTGMVFEIYDQHPDNRRAMFGGGRYDNLIGLFGKDTLSGVGFGMGDVSLENFLEVHGLKPSFGAQVDVFVSTPSEDFIGSALQAAQVLREKGAKVMTPLSFGNFGAQLKAASRHGAKFAILFGEEEWKSKNVVIKNLGDGSQSTVAFEALGPWFQNL